MKGKKLSYKERMAKLAQDKNERRRIFRDLCKHVEAGYSLDCFRELSHVTIGEYLTTYPEEFVREELDEAMRAGKETWEGIGRRQATGDCLGNSRSWYYNMSNRYGWSDKQKVEAEHKGQVSVSVVNYATMKSSTPA